MVGFLVIDSRIAARNLMRNKGRTLVSVLTVATGIIAFLLAGGFIEWVFESMREATIRWQLGHIQVVKPDYMKKGIADPYRFLLPEQSAEFETIRNAKGVVSISQRLAFSGLVSHGETTVGFLGEGIEPEREVAISDEINRSSGNTLTRSDEKAALLGEGLAKNLGVVPGDDIVLLATTSSGSPNAIEVKVAGIFFTASKEFDDNALRLPIDMARKLMRVEGSTAWVVMLDRTDLTATAVRDLRTVLPPQKFEVVPWTDLADFYNKTVVLYRRQINLMKYIIAILIVLTISNTQTITVYERTTEIGTIMAIGQRNSRVLGAFLVEGGMIGVFGGVLGLALGYLMATIVSAIGIPMPPAPGMTTGFTAGIIVTSEMMIDAFLLALVATLLASVLPAWRASRMKVVDALRCNQ
ncbi:MAG: ABC transporter permease [Candidatus Accumulibacter sp.]|nr:ABC transporter permease [Accumulibacter sp.]